VARQDLDALLTTENLRGLPPVFTRLDLLHEQNGKPLFVTDGGPLHEILAWIENRANYGEPATGRSLTDEFSREPFGWDFDVVRLFAVALLRAGKIEATSQGKAIDSALSLDARNNLPNNNLFRQASFRPKVGLDFNRVVEAYDRFKDVFGQEIPEIEQSVVAHAIRDRVGASETELQRVHNLLVQHSLPGGDFLAGALDHARAIRTGKEDQVILTFNAAFSEIKEAIKRGGELATTLHEPQLHDLKRAGDALERLWPALRSDGPTYEKLAEHAEQLADLLARETFFRELPAIDQHTRAIESAHGALHDQVARERAETYSTALDKIRAMAGFEQLDPEQQARLSGPMAARATTDGSEELTIAMLREQTEACATYLQKSIDQLLHLVEGNRAAKISAATYFTGGIESEEQLDQALAGLREECLELIGAGKKIFIQ
jgi:hypothetical protein